MNRNHLKIMIFLNHLFLTNKLFFKEIKLNFFITRHIIKKKGAFLLKHIEKFQNLYYKIKNWKCNLILRPLTLISDLINLKKIKFTKFIKINQKAMSEALEQTFLFKTLLKLIPKILIIFIIMLISEIILPILNKKIIFLNYFLLNINNKIYFRKLIKKLILTLKILEPNFLKINFIALKTLLKVNKYKLM